MSLVGNGITTSDSKTGLRISANVHVFAKDELGRDLNATFATQVPGTNPDGSRVDVGFAFFVAGSGTATLVIVKDGYKSRSVQVTLPLANVDFALDAEAVVRPTREQVLAVKASGCSMRDSLGRVMFTGMIGRLWLDGDMATVDMWIAYQLAEGCTHIEVGFQSEDYHGYWVKGFDFTGHEASFLAMLNYLLDKGLIPIIFHTSGDNADVIATYLMRSVNASGDVGKHYAVNVIGYETIGSQTPTLSSKQWYDFNRQMIAALGDQCVWAMHSDDAERCTWASARGYDPDSPVPGCHWNGTREEGAWVEDDDPSDGDEVGAMNHYLTPDLLFMEMRHGSNGPSGTLGDLNDTRTWSGHMVEIQDRFGADGTIIPGLHRAVRTGPPAPDWFLNAIKRTLLCLFETVWMEYGEGNCSEQQAIAASHRCRDIVALEGGYRK